MMFSRNVRISPVVAKGRVRACVCLGWYVGTFLYREFAL